MFVLLVHITGFNNKNKNLLFSATKYYKVLHDSMMMCSCSCSKEEIYIVMEDGQVQPEPGLGLTQTNP